MLEVAVLGVLKEGELHGYELRKRLTALLGHLWPISYGSLYPTLKRLERQGAVEVVRPASGARRKRRVYRITSRGETLFRRLLEEGSSSEDLSLRLPFFRYLGPEARLGILEQKRAQLVQKLARFRETLRTMRDRIDAYTLSLLSHGVSVTEHDIRWLDELIAKERRLQGGRRRASRASPA